MNMWKRNFENCLNFIVHGICDLVVAIDINVVSFLVLYWPCFVLALFSHHYTLVAFAVGKSVLKGLWSVLISPTKNKIMSKGLYSLILFGPLPLPYQLTWIWSHLVLNWILRMSQNLALHLLLSHLQSCLKDKVISENSRSQSLRQPRRISDWRGWVWWCIKGCDPEHRWST